MKIKEISIQNPSPENFFIRDLKKEYKEDKTKSLKIFFKTYEDYEKSTLECYSINKKYNLLDYVILEK